MQEDLNVDLLQEGDFVAVKLENCRKHPVIGKVFEVKEYVICYWKGSGLQQGMDAAYNASAKRF